jgi:hypothetical protein
MDKFVLWHVFLFCASMILCQSLARLLFFFFFDLHLFNTTQHLLKQVSGVSSSTNKRKEPEKAKGKAGAKKGKFGMKKK